jgi:hypothetical protein
MQRCIAPEMLAMQDAYPGIIQHWAKHGHCCGSGRHSCSARLWWLHQVGGQAAMPIVDFVLVKERCTAAPQITSTVWELIRAL